MIFIAIVAVAASAIALTISVILFAPRNRSLSNSQIDPEPRSTAWRVPLSPDRFVRIPAGSIAALRQNIERMLRRLEDGEDAN